MLKTDNNEDLFAFIRNDIRNIVGGLSENTLTLTKVMVESIVYTGEPSVYERLKEDGGFLGSWEYKLLEEKPNHIRTKIFSNPESMTYNPSKYQHGNQYKDRRKKIAEYIAIGIQYDFIEDGDYPRNYWEPIEDMTKDGTMDNIFENALMEEDIQFIKK